MEDDDDDDDDDDGDGDDDDDNTTENSHIGHRTHTSESANVKVQ